MPQNLCRMASLRELLEIQVTTSMNEFMANMNRGTGSAGTGGAGTSGAGAGGDGAGGTGAGGDGADGAGVGGTGPMEAEVTSEPPIAEPPNVESSDSESEDEEVDVAPEPAVVTANQRPFAIRDFPRGMYEVGESSAARDSSCVGGLKPWELRHDLESTRARARLTEAEVDTNRTQNALLDSKIKIGEKERKILDYDLGNVEQTLSNVVERLRILENGENATLKKQLKDKEAQLVIARMDCASTERRLHESIGWNRRFYLEMVRKGAVPKPPSDDENDERPRKMPKKSDKDEGPSEP
ncbi:hypothetical protein Tco_0859548 [Tanacetum coccineum]|uniref:Uncharacterized protein n=1 Tax=Tanacetum coccineum TaxID=301880 RepID=A0ABQ5BD05_9ASTR